MTECGCGAYTPKYNYSHVSSHFLEGTYNHAITQKVNYKDGTFQIYTDVDKFGNVGKSDFGHFNILRKIK